MTDFIWFTLKASVSLAVFYLFYLVFLRRLTFFRINRFFLLSGLVLSLIIPLIKLQLSTEITQAIQPIHFIYDLGDDFPVMPDNIEQGRTVSFSVAQWIFMLYLAGLVVFLIRQFLGLIRVRKLANGEVIHRIGRINVFANPMQVPFSFVNSIFLPDYDANGMILRHELEHIKQWHWFDLILAELISLILWFNPFVVLYKRALRLQHEYLADQKVLKSGKSTMLYLQCLYQQVKWYNTGALTSPFYCKTIKRRVIMMTKNKTSKRFIGMYLLAIPLICVIIMAFAKGKVLPVVNQISVGVTDNRPSISPIEKGRITKVNGYGNRIHPFTRKKVFHYGIDFAAETGTEIVATADGTVLEAQSDSAQLIGNYVTIFHNEDFTTFYSHMDRFIVKPSEKVTKGQVIGYVGSTGKYSTGPHLHYEVIYKKERVNPSEYLPK